MSNLFSLLKDFVWVTQMQSKKGEWHFQSFTFQPSGKLIHERPCVKQGIVVQPKMVHPLSPTPIDPLTATGPTTRSF